MSVPRPEIRALADALQISVSELTRLPVPAPANGDTDSTTDGVRLALDGIDVDHPGGLVLPVAVLRDRVTQIQQRSRACRFAEVATELPGLIRDLHTTLDTGRDHAELLDLAVYLHVHVTRLWLVHAAAPTDLVRRSVFLARHLAQEHGEVTMLGMAGFAVADVLLNGGALEPGKIELDSLTLPPTTADTAGLVRMIMSARALAAVFDGRPGDAAAPMDAAAEIAGRLEATRETDLLGFPLASTNVEFRRVRLALEAGEPDRAVSIARNVHPERHPYPVGRAQHWVHYGRALSQLRRHDDAVRALRNAERIHPHRVQRDPFVRDTLAVLLRRSRRGSTADQELRGMTRRAGLPV